MKPYFKTTPFTTAASALLTILHYFDQNIDQSKAREFEIWKTSANLPTRASSIYGLALYAKRKGFNPTVIVEKKEYQFPDYRFYRYTKDDVNHASFTANLHFEDAIKENVKIEVREIKFEEVKKELKKGNLLLLRLNTKPIRQEKRNTSNYIVVHGMTNNAFHIVDPAFGAFTIPETIMKEAFETLKTRKFRDHRMVVFEKDEKRTRDQEKECFFSSKT